MTQQMIIVNASHILTDRVVEAMLPALRTQVERDFLPAWGSRATAVDIQFATAKDIPSLPHDSWPIFLNKHSQDPGALGWHTEDGAKVYGRVFVGDCLAYGIAWETDLGHEVLETLVDPDAQKAWRMPDGRLAALEVCDAVEADQLAYQVPGASGMVPCTNFVLPAYFSAGPGPYDHQRTLQHPCPALAPGGYMSLWSKGGGWTMVQADHGGIPGRRFLMARRHRRELYMSRKEKDLEVINKGE